MQLADIRGGEGPHAHALLKASRNTASNARHRLHRTFQHLHHLMHNPHRPLRILYSAREEEISLAWVRMC